MDIQKQIKLLEELFNQLKPIRYSSRDNFDILEGKAKMYVRKFFGDDSHYLAEIEDISYFPMMFTSDSDDSYFAQSFETGVKSLRDLLVVMMEDLKLSTNYDSMAETKTVSKLRETKQQNKQSINPKEIHVLIASPGDVIEERESLLNSLETKFRRLGYEQRCGYRVIIRGWEELATQSGYGQDIINAQILSKVDIVLAVFKHKLGNPTKDIETGHERSKSGTAEELLYAISNSIDNPPLGMVYFYSEAPKLSFDSPNFDQAVKNWEELKEFKNDIKDHILYKSYKSEENLLDIACEDLVKNIENFFNFNTDSSVIANNFPQSSTNNHEIVEESPEQKKRKIDISNLKLALNTIHIPTFDRFINEMPMTIIGRIFYFKDEFVSLLDSSAFHIYDKELKNKLENFKDCWNKSLSFYQHYGPDGKGENSKFYLVADEFQTDQAKEDFYKLVEIGKELEQKFKDLLLFIRTNYLEVDIEKESNNAFEKYKVDMGEDE